MRNQIVNTHIERAVECFRSSGKQKGLADKVGVTQGMVSGWLHGRYPISWVHAKAIEEATNGSVTRYQLRPDIFGKPPGEEAAA